MAGLASSQTLSPALAVRLPVVDVLRAIAIVFVFVFHYFGMLHGWDFYRWDGPWRDFHVLGCSSDVLLFPVTWGWSGVSLFFVLSGFVIHLQTLSRPAFSPGVFLRKRLWRIVPAYYVAVVVFGLHFWISPFEWSGQRQYLTHVLFIHNWFPDTFFGINGPFWSLASEVQFYLAYPLVVLLRTRIGMGWILFGATALSFVSRSVFSFWFDCEYPITPLWTSFPVLWVDWLLGSWVAERFREGKMAFPGFWWLPASLTAFVLAGLWKPTNCLSFSLSSLVWAVILDRVIRPDWQPRLVGRFLVHLGLISYSMYLWHHPLMEEIYPRLNIHRERFPLPGELISVLFFFIVWTLIYIVSVMSFRWVEDPSWLWKRQVKQP